MERESRGMEYDQVLTKYYDAEEEVLVVITVKVEAKDADRVAQEIANFVSVEDVYLVAGDTDLVAKARFEDYRAMKEFLIKDLVRVSGVKETKTFLVVAAFKDGGVRG